MKPMSHYLKPFLNKNRNKPKAVGRVCPSAPGSWSSRFSVWAAANNLKIELQPGALGSRLAGRPTRFRLLERIGIKPLPELESKTNHSPSAFTLIELLVVIAI